MSNKPIHDCLFKLVLPLRLHMRQKCRFWVSHKPASKVSLHDI